MVESFIAQKNINSQKYQNKTKQASDRLNDYSIFLSYGKEKTLN